jgi:hypothetical protein
MAAPFRFRKTSIIRMHWWLGGVWLVKPSAAFVGLNGEQLSNQGGQAPLAWMGSSSGTR